jgi:hypothetical protein
MAVSSTFVSADGDGYEFQMGRWSRRLAPLFIDFAEITSADVGLIDVVQDTLTIRMEFATLPISGRPLKARMDPSRTTLALLVRMPKQNFETRSGWRI